MSIVWYTFCAVFVALIQDKGYEAVISRQSVKQEGQKGPRCAQSTGFCLCFENWLKKCIEAGVNISRVRGAVRTPIVACHGRTTTLVLYMLPHLIHQSSVTPVALQNISPVILKGMMGGKQLSKGYTTPLYVTIHLIEVYSLDYQVAPVWWNLWELLCIPSLLSIAIRTCKLLSKCHPRITSRHEELMSFLHHFSIGIRGWRNKMHRKHRPRNPVFRFKS